MCAKPDLRLSASQQRRQDPCFLARCAIGALAGRLPLRWPSSPETPPSPKRHYRSHYQPPDPDATCCLDSAAWAKITPFDLILLLVDFSDLRPALAALLYKASARGHTPFDPVSLFLLIGWQVVNGWQRTKTLRHLADPRYADYATAFGFQPGRYPTESGLRYFLTTVGKQNLTILIEQSMTIVRQAGLITPEVAGKATVSFDGMIHDAASRMRCSATQDRCYQPTSPDKPRPCPAKEKGRQGCACQTTACQLCCYHAAPRDPDARFVWYSGSNQSNHPDVPSSNAGASPASPDPASPPPKDPKGKGFFGYRSLPAMLVDFTHRTTWVLGAADLAPANKHEDGPAAQLLRHIVTIYPWLHVQNAVGDAAYGFESFLATAYELHIRRVVDLRSDPRTDNDKDGWMIRGYNDKGRPVCQFGCRLHPNGYDEQRQRSKWCCRHACEESTTSDGQPDCPYRDRACHPFGLIKNIGRTFDDGSLRLVRDVPYGSSAWKELYRRARNGVESRNSKLAGWRLKRLPVFGTPRAQATTFLADVWGNLTTLARLITEATRAQLAQTRAA